VHGHTRHALERKGLVFSDRRKGWKLTVAGELAIACPAGVPNIFDDLFDAKKESVMPKAKAKTKTKKQTKAEITTMSDAEIDGHPLLDREQQKLCKGLRNLAKRRGESFTMAEFAAVALRATGNDYAAVTDEGGHAAAMRDKDHQLAAILYVYEALKAGPDIVTETVAERGTLRDLELLASYL
jgi:hypothetical protein